MFSGPIPGESLTREPGNAPWEQPPQFTTIEEILSFYLKKFEKDDKLEELLFLLEQDTPLDLFINTILMYGEMQGKHTADMSILVGPILHEYIKALADAAGIKYREFQGKTTEQKKKEKEKKTLKIMLGKGLGDDAPPLGGMNEQPL